MKTYYSITGIYYQFPAHLDKTFEKSIDLNEILKSYKKNMFFGIIISDSNVLKGYLHDHLGESIIYNIKITSTSLSFTKKYSQDNDEIDYNLSISINNDIFIGEFLSITAGRGVAKCILSRFNSDFFTFEKL